MDLSYPTYHTVQYSFMTYSFRSASRKFTVSSSYCQGGREDASSAELGIATTAAKE